MFFLYTQRGPSTYVDGMLDTYAANKVTLLVKKRRECNMMIFAVKVE